MLIIITFLNQKKWIFNTYKFGYDSKSNSLTGPWILISQQNTEARKILECNSMSISAECIRSAKCNYIPRIRDWMHVANAACHEYWERRKVVRNETAENAFLKRWIVVSYFLFCLFSCYFHVQLMSCAAAFSQFSSAHVNISFNKLSKKRSEKAEIENNFLCIWWWQNWIT